MKCAIMQPSYLPWLGYFALIDQVDVFIFLDDVQFSHQSWQQRNRIKGRNGPIWLTVPTAKETRDGLIKDVTIAADLSWARKHRDSILQNYAKVPHFARLKAWLETTYTNPVQSLCQLNTLIIRNWAEILGIETRFALSSEFAPCTGKIDRLIDLCRTVGANEYLSPVGSYEYIAADNGFRAAGIELSYLHYEHPVYWQAHGEFVSHLSTVDLLMNEGPRSLEIVRSGIRAPYLHDELGQRIAEQGIIGDSQEPTAE